MRFPGEDPLQQWGVGNIVHAPKVDNNNKKPSNPIWLGSLRPRQQPEVEEVEETNRGIVFTKPSTMAIFSLSHVVVQRVMGCARSSVIDYRRGPGGHQSSPSGHIPNKSSPFAKVLKHPLLFVCMRLLYTCGWWLEDQKLDQPAAVCSEMLATGRVARGQRLAALWPKGSGWRPVVGTGEPVEMRASWHG